MHVPNGFLSDPVCAASTEASPAALGVGFARARQSDDSRSATLIAGGLIAALAIVGLLAPWASSAPDGLDRMAQDLQFAGLAASSWALVPEYAVPGAGWPALAVALAGIAGVVFAFVSGYSDGRGAMVKVRKH
jgi:cobalt/nickel transport protein